MDYLLTLNLRQCTSPRNRGKFTKVTISTTKQTKEDEEEEERISHLFFGFGFSSLRDYECVWCRLSASG